jgi:hypothetical protein
VETATVPGAASTRSIGTTRRSASDWKLSSDQQRVPAGQTGQAFGYAVGFQLAGQ